MENNQLDEIYSYIRTRRREGTSETQLRYELIATGHKDIDVTHYLSAENSQIKEPAQPKVPDEDYDENTIPAPSAVISPKSKRKNSVLPINVENNENATFYGGDISRKNLLNSQVPSHSYIYSLIIVAVIVAILSAVFEYRNLLMEIIHEFYPQ